MTPVRRRHRQAALAYALLGLVVIALTFGTGQVPASRRGAVWELAMGAVFVVIFAVLVDRGWWVLAAGLVISNAWRALTYFNAGLGWHVELLPWRITRLPPQPAAFLNSALMAVIVWMLARSAWAGFAAWHRRGRS